MKLQKRIIAGLAAGILIFAGSAGAAVVGSKHDLSVGSGNNVFTPGTANDDNDQVCVFCHTPHGANTTEQIIPLWNRDTSASNFTLYQDTGAGTLDGATADDGAATGGVGGVSLACLSCHDGSVALASVINAPGGGGTAETNWATGTWTSVGSTIDGALDETSKIAGTALLGNDLSNDHPVAIQYAGGGYVIKADGTGFSASTPVDTAFKSAVIAAGSTQAWVDVDGGGTKTSGDLPLFTNFVTDNTKLEPFVECASCHDPHDGSGNGMFLRAAAKDSAICVACHVK